MQSRPIEELYAFLAQESEGDGIVAVSRGLMMFPLVTSNPANLPRMRADAQLVADQTGHQVTLVRFTSREDIEKILPVGGGYQ